MISVELWKVSLLIGDLSPKTKTKEESEQNIHVTNSPPFKMDFFPAVKCQEQKKKKLPMFFFYVSDVFLCQF